jgi:hypothetical protein
MSSFFQALRACQPKNTKGRRWLFVPYDQLVMRRSLRAVICTASVGALSGGGVRSRDTSLTMAALRSIEPTK